ncbi:MULTISPECIES: cytochrome P450 [unclassified Sphingobium]|uniref:cytochrome P450 n=1 Tax=unclassified Sphingobium TaxID=2611147 RepID=UPI00344A200D
MAFNIPDVDIDIYSAEALANPYENYRIFRDTAPIVRLPKYDLYLMARFADVQGALKNNTLFASGDGVAMNDLMNKAIAGSTLHTDAPYHSTLRSIVSRPLTPARLTELRQGLYDLAENLVERLVAKGDFDAASELAPYLPVTVVSELVGLPEEGRERMLIWAGAVFNSLGPRGLELTETALPIVDEMVTYARGCTADRVKPGSWVAKLYEAVEAGELRPEQVGPVMGDYLGPSLDTTILATGSAIALFAQNPDQWDKLRANPTLIPNAVNEAIRVESPIQGFSRVLTDDFSVEDQRLHKGARVLVMYASGNRDERRWEDPERFDITRRANEQLGFGHGIHMCMGANLARMEISALLSALIRRVERFDLHEAERISNNVLRGYKSLKLTAHAAQ